MTYPKHTRCCWTTSECGTLHSRHQLNHHGRTHRLTQLRDRSATPRSIGCSETPSDTSRSGHSQPAACTVGPRAPLRWSRPAEHRELSHAAGHTERVPDTPQTTEDHLRPPQDHRGGLLSVDHAAEAAPPALMSLLPALGPPPFPLTFELRLRSPRSALSSSGGPRAGCPAVIEPASTPVIVRPCHPALAV